MTSQGTPNRSPGGRSAEPAVTLRRVFLVGDFCSAKIAPDGALEQSLKGGGKTLDASLRARVARYAHPTRPWSISSSSNDSSAARAVGCLALPTISVSTRP